MASAPLLRLSEAKSQGILVPTDYYSLCWHDSVNTANLILFHLASAGDQGLDAEQLSEQVNYCSNTCKIFLRTLVQLGLVERHLEKNNHPRGEGAAKAVWFIK
jgi:hypothetical protein